MNFRVAICFTSALWIISAISVPFLTPHVFAYTRNDAKHGVMVGTIRVPEEPLLEIKDVGRDTYHIGSESDNFTDSGVVAYIAAERSATDPRPMMPQLQVRLENIDPALVVKWRFEVAYRRQNNPDLKKPLLQADQVAIPTSGTVDLPSDTPWNIYESYKGLPFFGGNATISFTITSQAGEFSTKEHHYRFRIGGKNPSEKAARDYIDVQVQKIAEQTHLPTMWYAYAIAKEETKYEAGRKEAPYYHQFLPLGYKRNEIKPAAPEFGKPNWNNDGVRHDGTLKVGGFGLFQVTGYNGDGNAHIPREVIWNWQTNVDAGLQELVTHEKGAIYWMAQQFQRCKAPIPDYHIVLNNGLEFTFSQQGARTVTDLVAIKSYNASSCRHRPDPDPEPDPRAYFYTGEVPTQGRFVYWSLQRHKWCASRYNGYKKPFVYVDKVCLEIEQGKTRPYF